MQIKISGYPLTAPITLRAEKDEHIIGEGFLLDIDETCRLIEAWCDAPTHPAPGGEEDVHRSWSYSELGLFVTVLYMDGELTMDHWESATGSDGTDLYSTTQMPFDFTVHNAVEITDLDGAIEQVSRKVAETADLAADPNPDTGAYEPMIEDTAQLAAFITDGINAYLMHAQISTDEGYVFTPQITDDSVGYTVTEPSGREETITLTPAQFTYQQRDTGTVFVSRSSSTDAASFAEDVDEVTFTDSPEEMETRS